MKYFILILLICTCFLESFSQNVAKSTLKNKFDDADYDYSIEDYYTAATKYQWILKYDSLNANVNYCVGVCYMKTKFDKKKSIPFLEKAVKRVSNKYIDGTYEEKKAKSDAFLLLGQAYRMNNELDKAVEALNSYKKLIPLKDKKNQAVVDQEIEACNNAKKNSKIKSFSSIALREIPELHSSASSYNPVLSADEKIIVFATQRLKGNVSEEKKLMFSKKIKNKWIKPIDLSNSVKTNQNMVPTFLSADGKYMLLLENEEGNSAIYESRYVRIDKRDTGAWSPAKKLNKNINTGKVSCASLSPDGKSIYFASERKGGFGGMDIYKSELTDKGDWGIAENIGANINTPSNEDAPFFTNANILFFSSDGHGSIGGLDLFYCKLDGKEKWAVPVSLGNMFNTTDDDDFYFPIGDGSKGYMSLIGDELTGEKDIYKVEIINP